MPRSSKRQRGIAVLTVLLAAACSPANATTPLAAVPETSSSTSTTTTTTTTSTTTTTAAPTTTTTTTTTTLAPDPYRTFIATARTSTPQLVAYDRPAGDPVALEFPVPNPHQFGGPLTLMVTEGEAGDEWLKVQLPMRPNGREGWIPAEDYVVTHTRHRAEVDLASATVKVYEGLDLIAETSTAIGTPRTPTPIGTFFIAAKRRNPPAEAYLGTHAIVLSGFSEALSSFSGGLPVIAIHGTNYPDSVLGKAVSNGCLRVPNSVVQFIAETVPIGAPVHISG